jgi:hypothetical protein
MPSNFSTLFVESQVPEWEKRYATHATASLRVVPLVQRSCCVAAVAVNNARQYFDRGLRVVSVCLHSYMSYGRLRDILTRIRNFEQIRGTLPSDSIAQDIFDEDADVDGPVSVVADVHLTEFMHINHMFCMCMCVCVSVCLSVCVSLCVRACVCVCENYAFFQSGHTRMKLACSCLRVYLLLRNGICLCEWVSVRGTLWFHAYPLSRMLTMHRQPTTCP